MEAASVQPMTAAQRSYLETLATEAGQPRLPLLELLPPHLAIITHLVGGPAATPRSVTKPVTR